jgi:hypothetical protein
MRHYVRSPRVLRSFSRAWLDAPVESLASRAWLLLPLTRRVRSCWDHVWSLPVTSVHLRVYPRWLKEIIRLRHSGKYAFHFHESAESLLGGRERGERVPNPTLPLKLHILRKCAKIIKCTSHMCMRVNIFRNHFEGVSHSTCHATRF